MSVVQAALWGAIGGAVVECLQFANAIRRVGGWPWRWPGEPGPGPLAVSIVVRLAAGAGLAAAAGASSQVTTVFGTFALGVAAPLVIEKIAQAAVSTRPPDGRPAQIVDPVTGSVHQPQPLKRAEAEDARG